MKLKYEYQKKKVWWLEGPNGTHVVFFNKPVDQYRAKFTWERYVGNK